MTKSSGGDVRVRRAAGWLSGALVVAAAVIVSCSDDDPTTIGELEGEPDAATGDVTVDAPPPPPLTVTEACALMIGALCDRYNVCAAPLIEQAWGDVANCKARLTPDCEKNLGAMGMGATPDTYGKCGGAYRDALCHYLFTGNTPACFPPVGKVAIGDACRNESQCITGFCAHTGFCGTCAVAPREGEACVKGQCPAGLACNGASCIKILGLGDDCDGAHPCSLELSCLNGSCVAGAKVGEPCGGDAPNCDGSKLLRCVGDPAKCVPYKFSKTGGQCGDVGADTFLCEGPDFCKPVDPPTDPPTPGTCTKRAADGAACNDDATKGAPCQSPSACIAGLCKYPDPAACVSDGGDGG
jgi:hypothetical protein